MLEEEDVDLFSLSHGEAEDPPPEPEAALAAQMIVCAVNDARTPIPRVSSGPEWRLHRAGKAVQIRREAVEWIMDDPDGDTSAPLMSWQWACAQVGLDPTWARERIVKILERDGLLPPLTLEQVMRAGGDPIEKYRPAIRPRAKRSHAHASRAKRSAAVSDPATA